MWIKNHILILRRNLFLILTFILSSFPIFHLVESYQLLDPETLENMIRHERQLGRATGRHHRFKRTGLIDHVLAGKETPRAKLDTPGYWIFQKRLTWKDAHQVCEEEMGHLATFVQKQEAESVVNDIFKMSLFSEDYDWGRVTSEFGLDRRYWIGLTDLMQEGHWVWAGKGTELNYNTMWYPNQPDHVNHDGGVKSGRLQHCVSLWNPAYWKVDANGEKSQKHTFDDLECDRKLYFICEEDPEKMTKLKTALAISNAELAAQPAPSSVVHAPAPGAPLPPGAAAVPGAVAPPVAGAAPVPVPAPVAAPVAPVAPVAG